MDIILIVIAVIVMIAKAGKKKKAAEEARQKAAAAQQMAQAPLEEPRAPVAVPVKRQVSADPRFPDLTDIPINPTPMQHSYDPRFPGMEGVPVPAPQRAVSAQEQQAAYARAQHAAPITHRVQESAQQRPALATTLQAAQGRQHALGASGITGRVRTESSIAEPVVQEGPALRPAMPLAATAETAAEPACGLTLNGLRLEFDTNSIISGVLYSEILGKPKALR